MEKLNLKNHSLVQFIYMVGSNYYASALDPSYAEELGLSFRLDPQYATLINSTAIHVSAECLQQSKVQFKELQLDKHGAERANSDI